MVSSSSEMNKSNIPASFKVYISYSHRDKRWKEELLKYLSNAPIEIQVLSDDLLRPSELWDSALLRMRNEADVFLLLVSENYLSSETIRKVELSHIVEKGKLGEAYVLPFILSPCLWHDEPFAQFQALPKFGVPVSEIKNPGEPFVQLVEALVALEHTKRTTIVAERIAQAKLVNRRILDLSKCNLDIIPFELQEMTWLTHLDLSDNVIRKIENLDTLANLQRLNLSSNEIAKLENLDSLTNLQELDLANNQILKIEGLEENVKLTMLGLSGNRIEILEGIQQLTELKALYIGHNLLSSVEHLEHMPWVKRIVLTNNKISSIKPLLPLIEDDLKVSLTYSYHPAEEGIFISNNPLSEPSLEVVRQGNAAILKHFTAAVTYGTRKLEILKLILVGNSSVGKTNFSEYLRNLPMATEHKSTHLLDIQSWDADFLKSEDGTPMRVNIFDFGGQDYYHDSHRMYYSHDTAYVLLWDAATNNYSEAIENGTGADCMKYENFPLQYWLESINYNLASKSRDLFNRRTDETKAKTSVVNAPILVLQNKIDLGEALINQLQLQQKYTNISCFFNVSLAAKKRTNVLYEVLSDYMNALNLSGRVLIEHEHAIVTDFLKKPRPFKRLTITDFLKQCKALIKRKDIVFEVEDARIIAEILNNIGIIFYNRQNGDDIIFTNISELNNQVKKIMDVAKGGSDKGLFLVEQVSSIAESEYILKLLEDNNSIIRISDTQYLAPQFLPIEPNEYAKFFLPAFLYTPVRFIYTAYFHKSLLLTLFSKYLSKKQTGSAESVQHIPLWRNGIIISRGEGASRQMVYIKFVKDDNCGIIEINTMAPYNNRGLEKEIENTLDELSAGWTYDKEVSVDSRHFFKVKELQDEVKNKIYEFTAEVKKKNTAGEDIVESKKNFTVDELKHLVDFEKLPKKLFISYSSKNTAFIKRFVTHLEVLKREDVIVAWYDRMIESGTKWDDAIRAEMQSSDVVIFLLSPDFLATDYIMKTELPLAIDMLKRERSKFFFVELQPCLWNRTVLREYQQTDNAGSISKAPIAITLPENDDKWREVIDELESKFKSMERRGVSL